MQGLNQTQTSRHIYWRRQYDQRRYMRHLNQHALNYRFRDILLNMLRLQAKPRPVVGFAPLENDGPIWLEKFTHVLEEFQIRYGPHPNGFRPEMISSAQEPFPNFASELAKKAAARMASLRLRPGEVLIKFGQRRHMEALLKRGALRLQPASYFFNRDHNVACRDNELCFDLSMALTRDDIVTLVQNPRDVPQVVRDQHVNVRVSCPTDFWIYCLTNSVEPRLFVDFNADSCVIIRNRDAFRHLVSASAACEPTLAATTMHNANVTYIDPLLPTKKFSVDMFIPLVKHFAYTYQDEFRFCWVPNASRKQVAPIDLQIGNLSEIADLVVL